MSRRLASFLTLSSSKIQEFSQNCCVFHVDKLKNIEEISQKCLVFDVVNF